MANLYNQFKTDPVLETQGFWYVWDDTTAFLLARAGGENLKFFAALEAALRPYRRQIDAKKGFDLKNKKIMDGAMREAFIASILLNWRGVVDENGVDLAFNQENAKKLMMDLPDLFDELVGESQRIANFQNEDIEEDAKN